MIFQLCNNLHISHRVPKVHQLALGHEGNVAVDIMNPSVVFHRLLNRPTVARPCFNVVVDQRGDVNDRKAMNPSISPEQHTTPIAHLNIN